ncbi:MAG: VWA domain-containing protein [Candidatus Spyradenecus sp.]
MAEETKPADKAPEVRFAEVPADNGLGLAQHTFVLFLSIVLSGVIHFGLAFWFGERPVALTPAREKAHITPENLPPMRIDTFVREAELERAAAEEAPDIAGDVAAAEAKLPEVAETARLAAPTLPLAPLPPSPNPGLDMTPPAPALATLPEVWARQEVAAIPETDFTQEVNPEPRWTLDAELPRVVDAPDLAASVEFLPAAPGAQPGALLPPMGGEGGVEALAREAERRLAEAATATPPPVDLTEVAPAPAPTEEAGKLAEEAIRQASAPTVAADDQVYQSIDDRLSLALSYYDPPSDPGNRYFRLEILRKPDSPLSVMPKDVVFVQDISGSITRARLAAAKEAMKSALFNTLRAGDRFNIFAFRDVTLTPSGSWMDFNPETRVRAETFIDSLRNRGNTDLFLLLQDLRSLPRDPKRPLIAIVITDGEPTTGLTETTRIIGEFTRLNKGQISVYAFGAKKRDPYFLDMLCYVNRGENTASSGNPDTLARELTPVFESIRNPVMQNLSLTFPAAGGGELHPRMLTNLYADRTLTLYGRVPRGTQALTCQLRGGSASAPYDALFTFTFAQAKRATLDLRRAWAERAMFDLLADYAENPSQALLERIAAFSRTYGVPNPYKREP